MPANSNDSSLALVPWQTKKAKSTEEMIEIRLPRPLNGELMYSPQEAIDNMHNLFTQGPTKPTRDYINRVKQTMIDNLMVPVGRNQLNRLYAAHAGPDTSKSLLCSI